MAHYPLMTTTTATTETEFAKALNWPTKAVCARLGALGKLVACSRCGGGGHYSYCQQYGTKCFKCHGSGKQLPRFSKRIAAEVAELVAAGGLDVYFAHLARIKAAKAALAPLCERAKATYDVIGSAYSAASKAGWGNIPSKLCELQTANNSAYWGDKISGRLTHPHVPGVREIEDMVRRGELSALDAVALVERQIVRLEALRAEYLASAA